MSTTRIVGCMTYLVNPTVMCNLYVCFDKNATSPPALWLLLRYFHGLAWHKFRCHNKCNCPVICNSPFSILRLWLFLSVVFVDYAQTSESNFPTAVIHLSLYGLGLLSAKGVPQVSFLHLVHPRGMQPRCRRQRSVWMLILKCKSFLPCRGWQQPWR